MKFWNNASGGWVNLQGGFGANSTYFGPEVSFGSQLHALFPTDSIYLVKYAVGGTDLAVDWNPNGSGACYNAFKSSPMRRCKTCPLRNFPSDRRYDLDAGRKRLRTM